ncbi:helix-turn-helix domain-containing protein [Flavobacterium sp. HTF]|uniref:helix-turn-helix domain-containing protein n=1 Tax=Flavobacterium sp. HTF TaxID=2170732 RepID=UPI000D5CA04F|nr:helix-turn-helix domain-containing protein [Flavobacterium sp. HTF]PWB20566.1 hypothetical protein DCO46_20675 [Flavobacterium sp. HTF]
MLKTEMKFQYKEFYADNRFSVYIKKIWILDNLANPERIAGRQVLPNGCFNIAVIEGNGLIIKHMGWEKNLLNGSYFCGQMTQGLSVEILSYSKATIVQLHPWTPAHFSVADMSKFTDQIVPFEMLEIGSDHFSKLPGRSYKEIYKTFLLLFGPMMQEGSTQELIYRASSLLVESNGSLQILKLSEYLGCSSRHLQKIFKKHIGISPKQLSLILRLRDTVDSIAYRQKDILSITDLALNSDFFDQAHFINAFRSFAKVSPKKINIPDYFISFKK